MLKISFTGYRPEKCPYFSEDDPMCVDLKERLKNTIEKYILGGAEEFYTGMARGVDTWSAEAVLELKQNYPDIRLNAVIPFNGQESSWDIEDKLRYRKILGLCDSSVTTCPVYMKGCMMIRNRYLVDNCDVLIAVYDGKPGGTRYTVEYARQCEKKIEILSLM